MLLTHNLSTIELGSISWRQVINQNFVYLDNNRIFVVEADANLPTSGFKANRFFYSKTSKKIFFDNGTAIIEVAGGSSGSSGSLANLFDTTNAAYSNSLGLGSIIKGSSYMNFVNSYGFLNQINSNTSQTSVFGSANYIEYGCYSNNIFGYNNQTTSGSVYSNIFGFNNTGNNGSNNNIFGNSNTSLKGSYVNSIGSSNSGSGGHVNVIGSSNVLGSYAYTTTLGYSMTVINSYSLNIKLLQNIRKVSYLVNNITNTTLTNIYITGTESINLVSNSFNNLNGYITLFNKTTQECKKIKIDIIVFVDASGVITLKQFQKTTIFEDTNYSLADINFLTTTNNNLILQVNTNNITSTIMAEINIEDIV